MTSSFQLSVDRSKIDPNFEGYKVSMDNKHFYSFKLEQNVSRSAPSSNMVTLQHMKVFATDNQLFFDATKSTDSHDYLFRILDSGHVQMMVYDKENQKWDTSIVANLEFKRENDVTGFPTNLLFTDKNIVVASDGISQISVFLALNPSNWIQMLNHKITENTGIALIEARILNEKLEILAMKVENGDGIKMKTRSRIHWITVKLDDIDYAETLTVEKSTEFVQNGLFETCTFSNDGSIIFLASEKPHVDGHIPEVQLIEQSWSQTDNIIEVRFKLSSEIAEEDVNINVTKTGIKLVVKETTLLNGQLGGEIDENDIEICADPKSNTLILKLKSTDSAHKKWEKLIALETSEMETLEDEAVKKMEKEEQVFGGTDEPMEECDEADMAMGFYWMDQKTLKIVKQCDVSGSQVLFILRNCISPAIICLRHDVDGILWSFSDLKPCHVATLQAFGYVQASKTSRIWSGSSPNSSLACIVEGNNRVLLYSQNVEVSGSLSNRKTSQKINHVAKQHLMKLECGDPIIGVHLTDTHLFAVTKEHVHVAQLTD